MAVASVAVVLGACSSAAEATDVGACFAEPPRELEAATTVPCDEGAFQLLAWEDLGRSGLDVWPGEREVAVETYDVCVAAMSARTGGSVDPALEVWFDHPDEQAWDAGSRRVTCAATRADGAPLGGSIIGG